MLLDLLSTDNQVTFNSKIANMFGLECSIYISEILNISNKALVKNKLKDNHFKLDREYLKNRTTLDIDCQKDIEKKLKDIGLVDIAENDYIKFDVTLLASILTSPDEKLIDNITKLSKIKTKVPKKTKQQAIIDNLKSSINVANVELKQAYCDWIDGVYANPKGFLSARAIKIAQDTVDKFADHDLDKALQLINIATVNGYRDMNWAIEQYRKNYKVCYNVSNNSIKQSSELSTEVF